MNSSNENRFGSFHYRICKINDYSFKDKKQNLFCLIPNFSFSRDFHYNYYQFFLLFFIPNSIIFLYCNSAYISSFLIPFCNQITYFGFIMKYKFGAILTNDYSKYMENHIFFAFSAAHSHNLVSV